MRKLVFLFVCLLALPAAGQPWDGNGVEGDPYLIWDACDMQAIGADANYWDAHFKLMADVNLSDFIGTSFNIIGTVGNPFTGVFDGNEHTISNFTYDYNGVDFIGLFGFVDDPNAEIRELGLIDPNVDAVPGDTIGSLVGHLEEGIITGCFADSGSISGVHNAGGLVGYNGYGTISKCHSTSSVSGSSSVGGLVGLNLGSISNCYSTGSVLATNYDVGGLVGENGGDISDCYSMVSVSGVDHVGGLVGYNWGDGKVAYSYSAGGVSGSSDVGGLVGFSTYSRVFYSFWDKQTSGQTSSDGGKGKTTAEMKDPNTYIGWGGCSDAVVWTIDDGNDYPRLWWENKPSEPLSAEPLSDFITGAGTESEPYLIYTPEELNMIGLFPCDLDKHFRLMADIDLTCYSGTEFNIIELFNGVFDGNGHTISNFSYNSTQIDNVGLFGYIDDANAIIKEVGLINADVNGGTRDYVGSLVGCSYQGTVMNSYIQSGRVSGADYVGGLVGNSDGEISGCYAMCKVKGKHNVGGLLGKNSSFGGKLSGTVFNCYALSNVEGDTSRIGGLIGTNLGEVTKSYADSDVVGDYTIGGLIGWNGDNYYRASVVSDCFANGSVSGNWNVGGLLATNKAFYGTGVIILNCYSASSIFITGGNYDRVGGFVGNDVSGSYTKCFWDSTVNPALPGIGDGSDPNVIGETTANMQTESTFTDAGWDFVGEVINGPNDFWDICEGTNYPKLVWQIPVGDFVCPDGVNFVDYAFFAEFWLQTIYGDSNGVELTSDGKVNWLDFAAFAKYWKSTGCGDCGGADFTGDGNVNSEDLGILAEHWMETEYAEVDLTNDGKVNFDDLRQFTDNWLEGI